MMPTSMNRRLSILALHVVSGLALAVTIVPVAAADTTWRPHDRCFSIELPDAWQATAASATAWPWADSSLVLLTLARTDGCGTLVVCVPPDTLLATDVHALLPYLKKKSRVLGFTLERPQAFGIGNRAFAVGSGKRDDRNQPHRVEAALTHMAGRPLLFLFTARGADAAGAALEAQLAIGTISIDDAAFTRSPAPTTDGPAASPVAEPANATSTADDPEYRRCAVPGTGVSLEVPAHFLQALLQPGFVAPGGGASIYVVPIPLPMAMAQFALGTESLGRRNIRLESSEDVVVDGRPAVLAVTTYVTDRGDAREMMLLTGDDASSLVVHAVRSATASDLAQSAMRRCLLSLTWDPSVVPFDLGDLDFTFDAGRRLQVTSRAHDRVILTLPGVALPLSSANTFLAISRERIPEPDREAADLARDRAGHSMLVDGLKIGATREFTAPAGPGCEITGTAVTLSGRIECDYYLAVVVTGRGTYVLEGLQELYAIDDLRKDYAGVAASLDLR